MGRLCCCPVAQYLCCLQVATRVKKCRRNYSHRLPKTVCSSQLWTQVDTPCIGTVFGAMGRIENSYWQTNSAGIMREKENRKSWKIEKFYGGQYETFLCLLLALAWQVLRCSFSICEKVEITYYLSRIVAWARAGSRQIYRPDSDFCGWD